MSHFTVLVAGPETQEELEKALAPYQENNMGDCPREFLEFNDVEDEYLREYENEGVEMIRCPDGELRLRWDDHFRVPGTFGTGSSTHQVPDSPGYERVQVPHKERYATFEEFVEGWHSREERDPEMDRYGYWENPNAKWDWYQVGGRWSGFFKLKNGAEGDRGEKSYVVTDDPYAEGRVDVARNGDVDWEGMSADLRRDAEKRWDEDEARRKEHDKSQAAWEAEFASMPHDMRRRFENALGHYNAPDTVETYKTWAQNSFMGVDRLQFKTREEYVAKNSVPMTFALLHNGEWLERGAMGWWGVVRDEKDCKSWEEIYEQVIESLTPDTKLWCVDCHI